MSFGKIFRNRKRFPYLEAFIDEAGTLPVGENEAKDTPSPNGTSFSSKAIPSVRINTHGRNDQEE